MPSLMAVLGLDGLPFQRGLTNAQRMAQTAGRQVASAFSSRVTSAFAGLVSAGAVMQLSRATINWASELRDTADALSVNVEWLQKMANGAKLTGGSIEDISKLISELNRSRAEAVNNPGGKNAQAFSRMGISSQDISGLSTQAFTQKLIEAFKDGVSTQAANDLQEVGGKSARNLIAAFANQFQSDAPILAESLIDELDAIDDQFSELGTSLKVGFAPALTFAADALRGAINWIKQIGAAIGGFFGGFGAKFAGREGGIKGFFKGIAEGLEAGFEEMQNAVVSEDADQQNEADRIASAKKAEREARKRRENAPPNFQAIDLQDLAANKSRTSAAPKIALNALQSIGAYAAVPPGEQQMQENIRSMAQDMKRLVRNTDGQSGTAYG